MTSFDYIIVGFGISGSILTKKINDSGKKVLVIDRFNKSSSSQVAAGLINPVTGRRVVKSWMADDLIPFAKNYYRKLEKETGSFFFHDMDLLEVIHTVKELNDWSSRMSDPGMSHYLIENSPEELFRNKISPFQKIFRITSSGWMNIPIMIEASRKLLSESVFFIDEVFEIESLGTKDSKITYKEYTADKIVFCEGILTLQNALWNWLPFLPAKGEIFTISCDDLPEDFILMSGIFIIPLGNKMFRAGSTYEWNYSDDLPTETGKQKLSKQLDDLLKVPYRIIDHRAGIRPTVKDRRPLIGKHPTRSNVFVFNGMGTKGVVLAPYFAEHFYEYLEEKQPLLTEVDVLRFANKN